MGLLHFIYGNKGNKKLKRDMKKLFESVGLSISIIDLICDRQQNTEKPDLYSNESD